MFRKMFFGFAFAVCVVPVGAVTTLPFTDSFERTDGNGTIVGNDWEEVNFGGDAAIEDDALRITSGSSTADGVKIYRELPRQNGLKISGRFTISDAFTRVWVVVGADGSESLRNGLGFNWRLHNSIDNQLHICDNTNDDLDCPAGQIESRSSIPIAIGQMAAFEMLIFADNAIELRLWHAVEPRPEEPTLAAPARTPAGIGSNLAVLESTRDARTGNVLFEEITVESLDPESAFDGGCCTDGPGTNSPCVVTNQVDCESGGGLFLGAGSECILDFACTALVVTMDAMSAEATSDGVLISWTTALEVDTVGFRVLRETADTREKTVTAISPLIHAAGNSLTGASYRFLDNARQSALAVQYYIEDIDVWGKVTRHGPIEVQAGSRHRPARRVGTR